MDVVHEGRSDGYLEAGCEGSGESSWQTQGQIHYRGNNVGRATGAILELVEYLKEQQVTVVVMEASCEYWKPFYFLMEDELPVMLANARDARNLPGRKTDVSDAARPASLAAHGLLRASFVPPEPIGQLRDLTRGRTRITQDRARQMHRGEKFLESSGIKLSSVVSKLDGKSARAMLDAGVKGERDPEVLADMALSRMRSKLAQLREALVGAWVTTTHW